MSGKNLPQKPTKRGFVSVIEIISVRPRKDAFSIRVFIYIWCNIDWEKFDKLCLRHRMEKGFFSDEIVSRENLTRTTVFKSDLKEFTRTEIERRITPTREYGLSFDSSFSNFCESSGVCLRSLKKVFVNTCLCAVFN